MKRTNLGKIGIVAAAFLILMGGNVIAAQGVPGGGGGQGGSRGGGAPPDMGEDEGAGNNLSFPVIWSDGVTKAVPGTYGDPVYAGEAWYVWVDNGEEMSCAVVDTTCEPPPESEVVYLQQDLNNRWQAESSIPTTALYVDWIDWGDNLEARSWTTNSQVRVETVLYQDLTTPMVAFDMRHVYGQGVGEMWGATESSLAAAETSLPFTSNQATVYSGCARLTIQALTKPRESADLTLTWNELAGQWVGDALPPVFNGGVWEAGDGPGYYSAEINIPGKVIYGYNWNVRNMSNGPGDYRITFSLDEVNCTEELNTFFGASTQIVPKEEEEEETIIITEEPDLGGGITGIYIDDTKQTYLTYIDVRIEGQGGGGGGSGGGGGNGPPTTRGNSGR